MTETAQPTSTPGKLVISSMALEKGYKRPASDGREILPILTGIHLELHEGERVAIVGESGVGKTTLLNILGGLDRPDAGDLRYRGASVPTDPEGRARWRRRRVGFIFQFHGLLAQLTAAENVALAGIVAGDPTGSCLREAGILLAKLGLGDRLSHLPDELSGGEQQRVAVARALLVKPDLVLADEPTGNLDTRTGDLVLDHLLELQRERRFALVMATHSDRVAGRCHRVLRLVDGRLV